MFGCTILRYSMLFFGLGGEKIMNEIIEREEIKVENMIYEIREKQVMLDSDLAILYRTETKRINEAVSRNKEKFPDRFSWKLNNYGANELLVAICDQKIEKRGGKIF